MINGKKLSYLRANENLTIRQLSEKANVAPSTITRIENGKSKGSILVASRLAKALNKELEIIYLDNEVSK